MRDHGTHIHQSPLAHYLQHERPCAVTRSGSQTASICLHGRNHPRARRQGAHYQRTNGPRSHSCVTAGEARTSRNYRKGEGEFIGLDSQRVSTATDVFLASRLFGVQREPFPKTNDSRLHRQTGGAPSKGVLQGRVDCVPQEARNRIRREISVGMSHIILECSLSPLTGLDLLCSCNPRLAPWATLYRRSAAAV